MVPPEKVRSSRQSILADRQSRRWQLQQAVRGTSPHVACIAVSRMPGAGGAEIGRRLAEQLDFEFFGREMVEKVSSDLDVEHGRLADLDERVRSVIDQLVSDAMARERLSEPEYLRGLTRVVATLSRHGSAVLVGRGAPFILSHEDTLRVLVVAPRELRIARYAEVKGIPLEEASAALALAEQRRGEFARRYFGVEQNDPSLYDLVVNSGSLGFEAATRVVLEAYRSRFPD